MSSDRNVEAIVETLFKKYTKILLQSIENSSTHGQHGVVMNQKPSKQRHNTLGSSASSSLDQDDSTSIFEGSGAEKEKNRLYKTEMCRSWRDSHTCNYGEKCQYAHGEHELRPIPRHPKYKTKLCNTFTNRQYCPYGPRCHFIHGPDEARHRNMNYAQLLVEMNEAEKGATSNAATTTNRGGTQNVQQSIVEATQSLATTCNMPLVYDITNQQLNLSKQTAAPVPKKNTTPLSNDSPLGGSLGSYSGSASPNSCYSPGFQITSDYDDEENKHHALLANNTKPENEKNWLSRVDHWSNEMAGMQLSDIAMPPKNRAILKHTQHAQLTATKSVQPMQMQHQHAPLRHTYSNATEHELDMQLATAAAAAFSMAPQPAPVHRTQSQRLPVFAQLSARNED